MRQGSRILFSSAIGMAAVTASLVYLLDPSRGHRRRRMLRKQGEKVAKRLGTRLRIAQLRRQATRQFNAIDSRLRDVGARI